MNVSFYRRLNVGETQGDPPYASEGGHRWRKGRDKYSFCRSAAFTLNFQFTPPHVKSPWCKGAGGELRRVLTPAKGSRGWCKGGTLGWPLTFPAEADPPYAKGDPPYTTQ